jgi:glycosyltransferase involved in cell wall biosynthesis
VSLHVYPRARVPWRLGRSPAMRTALRDACRGADAVHVHNLWMMPSIYPPVAMRGTPARLVVSPHGTLSPWALARSRLRKRFAWYVLGQRRLLAAAALFHATSQEEAEDIRRLGYRQPVALIPNGVAVPDCAPPDPGRTRRTLLFLSRIHPKKGLDLLLRAWARLEARFPDWDLEVVGPDNEGHLEQMQRLAGALGLARVAFRGPLYGEDKLRAYATADLYVLPSWSENFGYTVAEALVCRTPAVTTRPTPWAALEHEGCGWWIDTGLEPLAACLERALQAPRAELDRMGERGRAYVARDLSWMRVAERMDAAYRWLLQGGTRPDFVLN